jgi:hypothetical protein
MPWIISDYEPVHVDDPEPETLSDHQDDACTFCGREIFPMRNLVDVRAHGCIIDGSPEQAERCWQFERRRREAVAQLHAGYARFNESKRRELVAA